MTVVERVALCVGAKRARRGAAFQGYLAHKKHPTPKDPTAGLCLGTYHDLRGGGGSYEQGTPVGHKAYGPGFTVEG